MDPHVYQLPVGIQLGRAYFRWRVSTFALSVARWVHNSTLVTLPQAPPIIPGSRFSQVRFGTLAFLPWAFPVWRGLSAD